MKLGSLKAKNARDGVLAVVKQDLSECMRVSHICKTLQEALEHWERVAPALQEVYEALNEGRLKNTEPYKPEHFCAPLPRAYQWIDASAYVHHVELVRKARNSPMPANFWTDPLVYQGGSDAFIGPTDPIACADEAFGVDFEAEIAVIVDDVPMGVSVAEAEKHIKLLMLVNDVSLRNLVAQELEKGFGFLQSKPSSAFSPLALTVDELAPYWKGGQLHLPLKTYLNGALFGEPNAGEDMVFSFPQLIAHVAKTRPLSAGSIIGSGTVSNKDRSKGSSCIVEKRMLEILDNGKPETPYLRFGDKVYIEMLDPQGNSLFGAIDQTLVHYPGPSNETL